MEQLCCYQKIRILPDNIIHIRRQLPSGKGNLKVMVGQEVSPEDILGEGQQISGFRTIHLAKELGTSPKNASRFLKRPLGRNIYQGELLASSDKLFGLKKKILVSPVDGVLDFYDDKSGDLKIKLLPKLDKLPSGVYGIVEHIDSFSGSIMIKTQAAIIYGVLGVGKERAGILKILGSAENLTSAKQIQAQMRGQVLAGGGLVVFEALEKAVSLGVAGLITGGIGFGDFKSMAGPQLWQLSSLGASKKYWSDIGLSLVSTEGFGLVPIGKDIFQILKSHEGKFTIIDGNSCRVILPSQDQNSMMYTRKTALPKVAESRWDLKVAPEKELKELKVGASVRIVSFPYLGFQGAVEAIDKTTTQLPSGVKTIMATILTNRQKIKVPYQNLEII